MMNGWGKCVRYHQGGGGEVGWDVESPHILADSFRAKKNGCQVSCGKDLQCGRGEEARARRGLKEGRDGEKRVG